MRNFCQHIIFFLTPVVLSVALTACSEHENDPHGNDDICKIGIYIQTGKPDNTLSKAPTTPTGGYDSGYGYENFIGVTDGDFRVVVYDKNDQWLLTAEMPTITPQYELPNSKTYLLEFGVGEETLLKMGSSFKIAIFANWQHNYPVFNRVGNGNLNSLFDEVADSWLIDYSAGLPGWNLADDDRIAMYGVTQFDNINLELGTRVHIGTIHLLRAMAKVIVRDAADSEDHLSAASLTRHLSKAVPMPEKVTHQYHYVFDDYEKDYDNGRGPSLPVADYETAVKAPLQKNSDSEFVIYVPEFKNKGKADEDQCRIWLHYDSDGQSGAIEFKYYSGTREGETMDIMRNNIYIFELQRTPTSIKPTVFVRPWFLRRQPTIIM
ncbi:MAG: hypothetical protein NC343_05230 [Muribaculum sp.]|nr:hypothetical protein [Muribaculaceae bacterium]MCM1081133.1 hypothetical protein [Muribaculum sp.]